MSLVTVRTFGLTKQTPDNNNTNQTNQTKMVEEGEARTESRQSLQLKSVHLAAMVMLRPYCRKGNKKQNNHNNNKNPQGRGWRWLGS